MRPFPNVGDGQWLVSNTAGGQPRWGRNGRELFYRTTDAALMAVAVNPRGAMWSAGNPTKLIDGRSYTGGGLQHFDVSPTESGS